MVGGVVSCLLNLLALFLIGYLFDYLFRDLYAGPAAIGVIFQMKSRVLLIFSSCELYQIQSTNEVPSIEHTFTLNGKKRTSSHSTQTLWQMMMSDRLFTQVLVQRNIWRGGSSVVTLVFWRTGWFTVKWALFYIDAGAALSKMSSASAHLIVTTFLWREW